MKGESLTPEFKFDADYVLDGQLLLLPIRGKGKCSISLGESQKQFPVSGITHRENDKNLLSHLHTSRFKTFFLSHYLTSALGTNTFSKKQAKGVCLNAVSMKRYFWLDAVIDSCCIKNWTAHFTAFPNRNGPFYVRTLLTRVKITIIIVITTVYKYRQQERRDVSLQLVPSVSSSCVLCKLTNHVLYYDSH
jgi:hypothetical protein